MNLFRAIRYGLYKKKLVCRAQRGPLNEKHIARHPIDFVVTWVDGNDPEWILEKEKHEKASGIKTEKDANGKCRYRDWGVFRYWFRAVEKYAPWVNNVYLVTCGQVPEWLDVNAPKLKIVNHKDFIPEQYLPTFNCNPIELNLHRIKGLSEHFVYFNDDVFLNRPVVPEDFFVNGMPNHTAVARPLIKFGSNDTYSHMRFSTMAVINDYFNGEISRRIETHPDKWFAKAYGDYYVNFNLHAFDHNYLPGMWRSHLGVACTKSVMYKVWEMIPEHMHKTCVNKFRTQNDIIHQIFPIWAMVEGEFNPVGIEHHGKVFSAVLAEEDDLINAICNNTFRMICINDSELVTEEDYFSLKREICEAYKKILPKKSCYEK